MPGKARDPMWLRQPRWTDHGGIVQIVADFSGGEISPITPWAQDPLEIYYHGFVDCFGD